MWFICVAFSWVITTLCIVLLPVHAQTECPENHVQCLNNNGSMECYNSTQLCAMDWTPQNCYQIEFNNVSVECVGTVPTIICNNTSSELNISLQHLCINGTINCQQLCNGTVDSPDSSGHNGTLCLGTVPAVICNNTSSEVNASSLQQLCNVTVECPEMTYPSPEITVSFVKRDHTEISIVFLSSTSNSVIVPAGSYLTINCSVNITTGMNYTVIWSSPFQSALCGPVISEDGRSWSQVATSVLNGTHTCGYLLGNEMAPVNTSVSVIVEGSGLFYRSGNIATPLFNNSITYIDNSSSPLELWCASDLLFDMFNTNYTHSFIGIENTELLSGNTSGLFEFSNCGPSFQLKYYRGDFPSQNSQGVYTCQVLVDGGYTADLSFGLYNTEFQSALSLINLTIDSEAGELTLVCNTTGSPPTKVYWSFQGTLLLPTTDTESALLLTAGDSIIRYMTIQRVVNRTLALYDNKLVLSSNLDAAELNISLLLGTYSCTVSNSITMFNPSNTRSLDITGLYFVNEEHVIGRRSSVTCATDLPGIVVEWYAEGSSRAIVTSLGSSAELVFDPVNATLNGTSYSCTTLTYYGIQEELISIIVTEPARPVCSPGCQNGGTCEIVGTQMVPSCNCTNGYSGISCQCPPGHVENGTQCIATAIPTMIVVSLTSLSELSTAMISPSPTASGVSGGLSSSDRMLAIICGAGGGGLLLLVLVITTCFIFILCKTRGRSGKRTTTQMYTIDRNPNDSNDIYDSIDDIDDDNMWGTRTSNVPPPIIARTDNWEVDFSRLELKQKLSNGAFGAVYKAVMTGLSEDTLPQVIAVKLLKDNSTDNERSILIGEINLMKTLEPHPHVIQMVGCSITEEKVALIMEYCHRGNLREHLRENNSNFQLFPNSRRASAASIGGYSVYSRASKNSVDYGNSGGLYVEPNNVLSPTTMDENEELSLHALLSFGRQITLGMEYLSQHNIVHGDLAARNILVCKDFRAKISDFGLSNDLYKDISCIGSGCKVPLRWMAIEAMIEKQFTTESDMWSFGVVLWEIFSLGASPYSGLKNAEVLEYIANGYRLQKPTNCPEFLYLMMLECWNEEPSERPSFGTMRGHLDSIIATTEEAEEYMLLVGERNQ